MSPQEAKGEGRFSAQETPAYKDSTPAYSGATPREGSQLDPAQLKGLREEMELAERSRPWRDEELDEASR